MFVRIYDIKLYHHFIIIDETKKIHKLRFCGTYFNIKWYKIPFQVTWILYILYLLNYRLMIHSIINMHWKINLFKVITNHSINDIVLDTFYRKSYGNVLNLSMHQHVIKRHKTSTKYMALNWYKTTNEHFIYHLFSI